MAKKDGNGVSVQKSGEMTQLTEKGRNPENGVYSGMNKRVALTDDEWYPESAEQGFVGNSRRKE